MNRLDKTEPRPLRIDLSGTFIRRTDLSNANLEGANLSYADCQNALFRRVNFKNANLEGTNLKGADLSGARNLTREQLDKAIVDETTTLPAYLHAGIAPDVIIFNSLIASAPDHATARAVLDEMKAAGVAPNVVTFNSLIASAPDHATARALLAEMTAFVNAEAYSHVRRRRPS